MFPCYKEQRYEYNDNTYASQETTLTKDDHLPFRTFLQSYQSSDREFARYCIQRIMVNVTLVIVLVKNKIKCYHVY